MPMTAAERSRNYYWRHREQRLESARLYRLHNLSKRRRVQRKSERRRRDESKTALIKEAGGACAKCGFDDIRALNIDHVNDDGHLEDKSFSSNRVRYHRHVLKMLQSGKYQILCANCNQIKELERRRRKRDEIDLILEYAPHLLRTLEAA